MSVNLNSLRLRGIRIKRRFFRFLALGTLGIVIVAEIVVLSPSPLESGKPASGAVDPNTLIQDNEPTLAPGIPRDRIADNSIQTFRYVSIQNGEKQWRIESDQAFMYNP